MGPNCDSETAQALLSQSVSSVFAEMVFIDAVLNTETNITDAKSLAFDRCAAIDILAPFSCRLQIRVRKQLIDNIMENLFSDLDEAQQKKSAEDSLLEMLNIITGSFLSSYFGSGADIQLELPRYLYLQEQTQGTIITDLLMDAEGEPIQIELSSIRYRY